MGLGTAFLELPLSGCSGGAGSLQTVKLQVVSENTVATALLASWVAHDSEQRKAATARLVHHIRLHHVTQAYVAGMLLQLPRIGAAHLCECRSPGPVQDVPRAQGCQPH